MSTTTTTRKYEPLTKPLYTGEQLTARMREIQDIAIVLSPMTGASDVPPGWKISERYVYAQWEEYEYESRGQKKRALRGDVYLPFWGQGRVAPTQRLLNKIWNAAGGSIAFLKRVDDRKNSLICEVEGQLEYRGLDSEIKRVPCDKRLDLSGGSKAAGMTDDQYGQACKRIHELAMSEAYLRGIRKAHAMDQAYAESDLKTKPFVVYACVPDYDMSDKMTRAMVVASQLGCVEQLFGATGASRQLLIGAGPIVEAPNGIAVDAGTGEVVSEPGKPDDFTPAPPPPPEPAAPEAVCACEHGCQKALTQTVATATTQHTGRPLCRNCYVFGVDFDVAAHRGLDLRLEKNAKGWDAAKAAEYIKTLPKRGA